MINKSKPSSVITYVRKKTGRFYFGLLKGVKRRCGQCQQSQTKRKQNFNRGFTVEGKNETLVTFVWFLSLDQRSVVAGADIKAAVFDPSLS